jgi:hypothetical protein
MAHAAAAPARGKTVHVDCMEEISSIGTITTKSERSVAIINNQSASGIQLISPCFCISNSRPMRNTSTATQNAAITLATVAREPESVITRILRRCRWLACSLRTVSPLVASYGGRRNSFTLGLTLINAHAVSPSANRGRRSHDRPRYFYHSVRNAVVLIPEISKLRRQCGFLHDTLSSSSTM